MKIQSLGLGLLLIISTGCSNLNHTENGLLFGTGLGAGLGALIGHATGHTGAGALIGGMAGAAAGGLAGSAADTAERRGEQRALAAVEANRPKVSIQDVVRMTHDQLPPEMIINEIRTTRSHYDLNPDQLVWLRQRGVSDQVITEMQHRRLEYAPQPVRVIERPVVIHERVFVEEPRPYGMVGVGFYSGGRRR